jgi:hypothetical protein
VSSVSRRERRSPASESPVRRHVFCRSRLDSKGGCNPGNERENHRHQETLTENHREMIPGQRRREYRGQPQHPAPEWPSRSSLRTMPGARCPRAVGRGRALTGRIQAWGGSGPGSGWGGSGWGGSGCGDSGSGGCGGVSISTVGLLSCVRKPYSPTWTRRNNRTAILRGVERRGRTGSRRRSPFHVSAVQTNVVPTGIPPRSPYVLSRGGLGSGVAPRDRRGGSPSPPWPRVDPSWMFD